MVQITCAVNNPLYIPRMKYIESIQTIRPEHHAWSLSIENEIGVLREGVETSVRKALKAMTAAKKLHKENAKIENTFFAAVAENIPLELAETIK